MGQRERSVAGSMAVWLGGYVSRNGLGVATSASGYRLESDPDHVLAPAVGVVLRERAEALGRADDYFPGAPDVAVEVISSSDRYTDVEDKTRDYLSAGTVAVILVDPRERTATVHRPDSGPDVLTEDDTLAIEHAIPGWRLPVRDIFE